MPRLYTILAPPSVFPAALYLNCAAIGFPAALHFNCAAISISSGAPPQLRRNAIPSGAPLSGAPNVTINIAIDFAIRYNAPFLCLSSSLRIKIAAKRQQQEEKENRKRAQEWGDNLHTRRKRFSALRAMNPNLANRFRDAHHLMTMRTGKIAVRLAVLPAALA